VGFGLFVFNAMWLAKVSWSVTYDASGRAILRPALIGLVVCNAGFLGVARLYRRKMRL
jgi:hypothetical protein